MTPVPGGTLEEQAVRVAGAFAESGVQGLTWSASGATRELVARETDLVGLLRGAPAGAVLKCDALGVSVHTSASGLTWKTSTPDAAAQFAELLG